MKKLVLREGVTKRYISNNTLSGIDKDCIVDLFDFSLFVKAFGQGQ